MATSLLVGAVTAIGAVGAPSAAGAQDTSGTAAAPAQQEIVVTGSRVRRTDLTSAQPIQVIGPQYLQNRGFTNIADALNTLPGSGVGVTPNGDQGSFGTGRNYVNLFNLGSNRTLTLVNGRRFVSANAASSFTGAALGSQVDLNSIPDAFLDRIEVVQAGGAAVYGSDAVAGVINIILKKNYEGVEGDVQAGISSRDDYPTQRYRITAGKNFFGGRANFAISYEYNKTSALKYTDRPWTAAQYTFATAPAGSPTAQILISGRTVPELTVGGLVFATNSFSNSTSGLNALLLQIPNPNGAGTVPAQFDKSGNLVPYNIGQIFQATVATGGDGLSLAPVTALETPLERHLVNAIAHYDITDHIRLRGELFLNRNYATEPANQPIFNAVVFGGTSAAIPFNSTNPFLTAQARGLLTPGKTYYLSRGSEDIVGSNSVDSQADTARGVLTLEGDFKFYDRDFNWDISFNRGRAQGYFSQPSINQQKFAFATNVTTDASGNVVCAPLSATATAAQTAAYQGCAPLNLFGAGRESAAALAYVYADFTDNYHIDETDWEANFGGTLWKLPTGDLNFSVGYENRREDSAFSPNANSLNGVGRSVAIPYAKGGYGTSETYGEVLLPVVGKNFTLPGVYKLELDVSGRHVENSLAGVNNAHSYQGRWYPIPDLLLRYTKSTTFRAPSVAELFLPQAGAFSTATDPCDAKNLNSGPNPATRLKNCQAAFQALGLPANYQLTSRVQAATIPIITGGNPTLQNEKAKEESYGFVYQPHFIPHLAIAIDSVDIRLKQAISNFTLSSILSTCYDSPAQPTSVCGRFAREGAANPDGIGAGQIKDNPVTGYVNAGFLNFQGQTATLSYDFEPHYIAGFEALPGRIGVNVKVFHLQRLDSSVSGTGFDISRVSGTIGNARYTANVELDYVNGPFTGSVVTAYQSASRYTNTPNTQNIKGVDAYYLTDISASYKIGTRYTVRGGIKNLFDTAPPYPTVGIGVYDQIGQYFYLGANAKF